MNTQELKQSLSTTQHNALYTILCDIRDKLNKEIIDCNKYLAEKNDLGQNHRPDDPHETISYTRGKSIGYIHARDEIKKIIDSLT